MGLALKNLTPIFLITANNKDITNKIKHRLIELVLTLESEERVDSITLKLANQNIAAPKMGAKLAVQLGYQESGLTSALSFTIDEISHSGPPHILTVKARAAVLDSSSSLKEVKARSWHDATLFAVAKKIAKEHSLKLIMQEELKNIQIAHHDQLGNDLTALYIMGHKAGLHNLSIRVVNQQLVIAKQVVNKTIISKKTLELTTINADEIISYRVLRAEREKYHRVIATYLNKNKEYQQVSAGIGNPSFILPALFDNAESALRAAETRLQALLLGETILNISIPALPALQPQNILEITELPGAHGAWVIISATHRLSSSGFISEIRARQKH